MLKQGMSMLTSQKLPVFTLHPGNQNIRRQENPCSIAKAIKGRSGISKSLFSLRCSFPSLSRQEKFSVGFTPDIFPLPSIVPSGIKETRMASNVSPGKRKIGIAKNGRATNTLNNIYDESDSETDETTDDSNFDSAVVVKEPDDYQLTNGKEGQMLGAGTGVNVDLEVGDGEYILKIKRRKIQCSTQEDMMNEAKKMTQNAAVLLVQAKMLRNMGEQLLDQYQESLQYIFGKSASRDDLD